MYRVLVTVLILFVSSHFCSAVSKDNTYDQMKLLMDILTQVEGAYVEEVDTQKLVYSAAVGMLKPLDPFTQFMEPKIYKEMQIETEGKYGGLGIRISVKDDWLTVITPLPGTPAYRIGILPDDRIVKINDKIVKGISMEEAIKELRGDPGTKVKITIVREGVKEPVDYEIIREIIKLETLRYKILDGNVGYMHLLEFNNNSIGDMKKALQEFEDKGAKDIVFDLRNNPGGLLDVAVDTVKFFIGDNKMIVYTKGRIPQSFREFTADKEAKYKDYPMVVLINRGSASGSEIVAGALKDHKRALIMGSRSFGKASVQSVLPLNNGCAIKVTTAKYYTPSGKLIQVDTETAKGGIEPDIEIEIPREVEAQLQMQEEKVYPDKQVPPASDKNKRVEDVVLNRAIEMLKARRIFAQ